MALRRLFKNNENEELSPVVLSATLSLLAPTIL